MLNKVLIVDNDIDNIKNLSEHLEEEGLLVDIAMTAKDCLTQIASFEPDLVILDSISPDDIFDLCKNIKTNIVTREVPIVVCRQASNLEDLNRAYDSGAIEFIYKPLPLQEMTLRIKNILKKLGIYQELKKKNGELQRLNYEKNGIIEVTAHDLKNPLQSIIGFTDLLMSKISEDELLQLSYLHSIKSSALKAINIVKDLSEVNSIEEGKLCLSNEKFDIREIVLKIVEDYLFLADSKNQVIVYNEFDSELIVLSDKTKLSRIVDNLISNALKFSNSGAKIYVTSDFDRDEIEGVDYASITIRDEGPGFTNEDLTKIFGKFTKLSAKPTKDESSTGLGLSIVKKLTELLDGKLSLKSEFGKGSAFNIKFKIDNNH